MQKPVDITTVCEVPFTHLLVTGTRAATAVVNNAAFLYPAFGKGAGLRGEYIEYPRLLSCAVTNSPALAELFSQETRIMKTAHTGINSHLSTEGLLRSCQYRISFLTTIATEEPELICSDDCLSGFLDVLCDVEQMLRCVISKIHTEGAL